MPPSRAELAFVGTPHPLMNTKLCILGIIAATTVSVGDAKMPGKAASIVFTSRSTSALLQDRAVGLPAPGDYVSEPWPTLVRVPALADAKIEMQPSSAAEYSISLIEPELKLTPRLR